MNRIIAESVGRMNQKKVRCFMAYGPVESVKYEGTSTAPSVGECYLRKPASLAEVR